MSSNFEPSEVPAPEPTSEATSANASGASSAAGTSVNYIAQAFRRITLIGFSVAALIGVAAGIIGWVIAEDKGLIGALLGVAVPAVFLSITTLVGALTSNSSPAATMGATLGAWLVKAALLVAFMLWLGGQTFYHRGIFATVFVITLVGYLALEASLLMKMRVPYVAKPGADPAETDTGVTGLEK